MIVGIHQPNFLPWLGFWNKMALSDIFVLFDDVQFPRGKTYAHRCLIKGSNNTKWLNVTAKNKSELKTYREINITNYEWIEKSLNSIYNDYHKSEHFNYLFEDLKGIFEKKHSLLFDLNFDLIKLILGKLELRTKIELSSKLCNDNIDARGEEKIIHILKTLGATKYISGTGQGSRRYLDETTFEKNQIQLVWQTYNHPQYKQINGDFVAYLSIIDLLMNEGENSISLIRN